MCANNDQKLRLFAAALGEGTLRPLAQWPFDWAVNYATVRPESHLAAVVGDDPATLLTDVHNGTIIARLHGHQDYSFAAAWHPGGVLLATGNQDTTTLLWDVRKTNEPLTRLAGRMGAIRSLRFSPDGRFLAMSEPADFVHIYDVASGFQDCQVWPRERGRGKARQGIPVTSPSTRPHQPLYQAPPGHDVCLTKDGRPGT
ncbi:hypothetical protein Vafri_14014 [Volvox africanus]|uniref:DUF2415 domain-containing protein n=1 Tax=Volvox africanus TaxID=51714 RepID=A0A8J4BDD5_9CHLO|nr:hypothetical protein Vafri_14014 [Volvox africanus]